MDSLRYYSNKSIGGDISVTHPLMETLWLHGMLIFRNRNFGPPPKGLTPIQCGRDGPFLMSPNCLEERSINKQFQERNIQIGLLKNTIDNENIPTRGSKIDAWWEYHFISGKHDYHDWEVTFQKFFFLGIEQYEITPKEQREMGTLSFETIKKTLKVKNLKKRIFKRKVIVTQLQLGQAYEIYKGRGPLFVLHTLSNSTPMRGYTASPFHDFSKIAVSAEYRFPIMRLVEGTLFNEYGWVGKQFNYFSTDRLRNSWGFGIRLARKDLFLFRTQMGFHGLSAPVINITVDTAY
jgi:outer membrane protein assembly factor BamA